MTRATAVLGAILCALLTLSCRPDGIDLPTEVRDLQAATTPAEGSLKVAQELTHEAWSATARWEITTQMAWDEYTDDVGKRLSRYLRVVDQADHVEFRREVSGDSYYLSLKRLDVGTPLRVSVTFSAVPD